MNSKSLTTKIATTLAGPFRSAVAPEELEGILHTQRRDAELEHLSFVLGSVADADLQKAGSYAGVYAAARVQRLVALAGKEAQDPEARLLALVASDLRKLPDTRAPAALSKLQGLQGPDALRLAYDEALFDARSAMRRLGLLSVMSRVIPAVVCAFLLMSVPAIAWELHDNLERGAAELGAALQAIQQLVVGPGVTCAFFGLLGALFSVSFEDRSSSESEHWDLVRKKETAARLWMGALIGCVIAAVGPILVGIDTQDSDRFARILAAALVFGASQDAFFGRVLARASGR